LLWAASSWSMRWTQALQHLVCKKQGGCDSMKTAAVAVLQSAGSAHIVELDFQGGTEAAVARLGLH
jgi:hypothetical protein